MSEDRERAPITQPERKFLFEAGTADAAVTFKPLDAPIYLGPLSRPIASEYKITVPPELFALQRNVFFTNLMENTLSHMRGQTETLSYWGSDLNEFVKQQNWQRNQNLAYDCMRIGRELKGWDQLTPEVKALIENTVFDFNGVWEDLPVNDETFPSLWQARFFGIEPEKVPTRHYNFPKIRFKFVDGKAEWSEVFKRIEGMTEAIESGFERDNVLTVLLLEQDKTDFVRHDESLSEIVKKDWPNATYAVDIEARAWRCPIIVLDQGEKKQSIYDEYASEWRRQFPDGGKRIVAIPAVDETGLPTTSNEVVKGPEVAEAGYRVMVPREAPKEVYKKLLAHIVNEWISLDALDHYTVMPAERSFFAFDRFERSLFTDEDRNIWEGFCKWIKNEGLRIDFMNPVEFREQVFQRKIEKSSSN